MEECSVAMKQHRHELDENDEREEDEERDAERLKMAELQPVLCRNPDVECVLQLVLHDLQQEDDEEPQEVEHEEGEHNL